MNRAEQKLTRDVIDTDYAFLLHDKPKRLNWYERLIMFVFGHKKHKGD